MFAPQLLTNAKTQNDDALEGFEYISDVLVRCYIIEQVHLKSHELNATKSSQWCVSRFFTPRTSRILRHNRKRQ